MSFARALISVIMVFLLTSLLLVGNAQADTLTTTETRTIGFDSYSIMILYQATDTSSVAYTFTVDFGNAVDVLVLDEDNFASYIVKESFEYLPGTILNELSGAASEYTTNAGTLYYVVIDNTDMPAGGANPTGSVTVSFSVTATDADLPSFISDIFLIIAVGAILFVVVILVLLYFLIIRKPKPKAQQYPGQPGMKICPYCGSSMPNDYQYCPKCGRKW
jgi:hypothetical protein